MADRIEVVAYDLRWPELYKAEQDRIEKIAEGDIVVMEQIGSTAVPGLRAKPIIDIMAAIAELSESAPLVERLNDLGYAVIETGMPNRLFLRRQGEPDGQIYHLHIVEYRTWSTRKERLMRDYLLTHSEAVEAYGDLKEKLAVTYVEDSLGYTKAKTDFIQDIVDKARDALGLPRISVWNGE